MMPQASENKERTKKLEQIEKTVRSRVECEERAFRIVNKLIEDYVEGEYLIECAKFISKDHYNDIVEERAISRLCGYPVCLNSLGKTPNKKYHVSTKTNKVYEISERKNFCSNQCFRASRHFSAQIPESPLWMREKEPLPSITLLARDKIKGMVGDEVIGSNPKQILKDELEGLDELDKKTSTSKKNTIQVRTGSSVKQTSNKSVADSCREDIEASIKQVREISLRRTEKPSIVDNSVGSDVGTSRGDNASSDSTSLDRSSCTNVNSREKKGVKSCSECDLPLLTQKFDELTTKETSQEKPIPKESQVLSPSREMPTTLKETLISKKKAEPQEPGDRFPSKMDHLKALLSKRKNALSKMVDVQTVQQNSVDKDAISHKPQLVKEYDYHTPKEKAVQSLPKATKHSQSESSNKASLSSSTDVSRESNNSPAQTSSKQSSQMKTSGKMSPLLHVCNILKSWVTPDTVFYLSSGSDAEGSMRFSDPQVQQSYGALCHRLAAQEQQMEVLLDGSLEGEVAAEKPLRPSKPVPDYKTLREQTEAYKLNVMEFITGKKQVPKKGSDADEEGEIRLPTVDAYDQHQIRVRIVMDRLDKSLPDVLAPLSLCIQDVSSPIRELVHTCRLEKDNIVLRPGEWTLAALLLLRMSAKRYPRIEDSFTSDTATRHFSAVMTRLGHNVSDLQTFAQDILNSSQS